MISVLIPYSFLKESEQYLRTISEGVELWLIRPASVGDGYLAHIEAVLDAFGVHLCLNVKVIGIQVQAVNYLVLEAPQAGADIGCLVAVGK